MQAKGILSKSDFKTFSMRNKGHSTACVLDLSKACTVVIHCSTVLGLPIEIQVSKVCMDLPKVCTDWIVKGMQSLIKPWNLK